MPSFDYNYQNSFRLFFIIKILKSQRGLNNNCSNKRNKQKESRMMVVVVKCAIMQIAYSQKRLEYKGNGNKYRNLSWEPRSHVRILIYRMWMAPDVAYYPVTGDILLFVLPVSKTLTNIGQNNKELFFF